MQTTTTSSLLVPRLARLVVVEPGAVAMAARSGCLATVEKSHADGRVRDELRVRCPKPERMRAWFDGAERLVASLDLEPAPESPVPGMDEPEARVLTASGLLLRVTKRDEIVRLTAEVRSFAKALSEEDRVIPGPASASGWQLLHVAGAARVVFAGIPTRGMLDAKVSTTGQYQCEFLTRIDDGQMRATKSGWLSPEIAREAIEDVLAVFQARPKEEADTSSFVAAMRAGAEHRGAKASTAAMFERFAELQESLGDACLPELETPREAPSQL